MPARPDRRTGWGVAAVVTLVCAIAAPVAPAGATPSVSVSARGLESRSCGLTAEPTAAQTGLARELLDLVNAHRRSRGLRTVRVGPALRQSAAWKAQHMARYGYIAHADLPGRRTLAQRLRACGFAGSGWGEVLAAGLPRPQAVLRAWLASPPHRVVLEARSWRVAGAGSARSPRGVRYWVLDFGA